MMKEEFETLTNFAVTPDEYRDIEKKYMSKAYSDCGKAEFCSLWVKDKGIMKILQTRKDGNIELPFIKRYTNKELMELTVEIIKKSGDYNKAEKILDYFSPEDYRITKLTNYEFNFHSIADFGGSEGIYLNCCLRGKFDDSGNDYCKMGTFKTLNDDLESMKIMAELGGILNYYLSQFVNQNIKCFSPKEELRQQAMYKAAKQLDSYILSEKYKELLEKGMNGNLTITENAALQEAVKKIESKLQQTNEHEAARLLDLEQAMEI